MKKCVIIIILIFNVIMFASCAEDANKPQISIASNDVFQITIETNKTVYKKNEAIDCRAVLLYVGDEPLTVHHSDPLLTFGIDDDKYFGEDFGHFRNDIGLSTTFYPGDIMEFDFVKSGAFDPNGENAQFYYDYFDEENLILPKGEYELSAAVLYAPDEENRGETIILGTVANIKVN